MSKRKNAVEWEPGDPITEDADRARRQFSPDIGDDDREEYETQLWVMRTGIGYLMAKSGETLSEIEKTCHFLASHEVLNMRRIRYQRKLGADAEVKRQKQIRRGTRLGKSKLSDVPLLVFEMAFAKHKEQKDWLRRVTDDVIAHTGKPVSTKRVSEELRKRGIRGMKYILPRKEVHHSAPG